MINRVFNIFGVLKNVTKIIAKCKGALNTNGCSAAKHSLTDRLNEIKAKSKKSSSKCHEKEWREK